MASFTSTFSANAIADADGIAVVRLGPQRGGESWIVKRQTVQNSGGTTNNICTARVYRNVISTTTLIDGTLTGLFDISGNDNISVESGAALVVEWRDCIPGSVSTYTVEAEVRR